MTHKLNILIVEKEAEICFKYRDHIQNGYIEIQTATVGNREILQAMRNFPHIVILSYKIELSIIQEVVEIVHKQSKKIIILLYGPMDMKAEEIMATGVDDYIHSDISPNELLKRLHYIGLRIYERRVDWVQHPVFELSPYTSFDGQKHVLKVKNQYYTLAPTDTEILKCLLASKGQFISQELLKNMVWGNKSNLAKDQLKTYIYHLRLRRKEDTSIILSTEKEGYILYCPGKKQK